MIRDILSFGALFLLVTVLGCVLAGCECSCDPCECEGCCCGRSAE